MLHISIKKQTHTQQKYAEYPSNFIFNTMAGDAGWIGHCFSWRSIPINDAILVLRDENENIFLCFIKYNKYNTWY